MKVLMDADCLIKLTKAGIKEAVCAHLSVVIPQVVRHEVIELGKNHPDSIVIKNNLDKGLLSLSESDIETREATSSTDSKGSIGSKGSIDSKGEDAVLATFLNGGFAAICSDDKRFIRRLRALDVPYVTPAVCIVLLLKQACITLPDAQEKLGLLASFISSDEYHTVKWVLDTWRPS
jgi:rRNA-processing protein FCF1